MLPAEQARGEALVTLARTHFDPDLRPIEEQVLRHSCAYEDPADWTPDPTTPDPTRHETTGRPLPGSQIPEIRPTLLRWLLTTPDATALLEPAASASGTPASPIPSTSSAAPFPPA